MISYLLVIRPPGVSTPGGRRFAEYEEFLPNMALIPKRESQDNGHRFDIFFVTIVQKNQRPLPPYNHLKNKCN